MRRALVRSWTGSDVGSRTPGAGDRLLAAGVVAAAVLETVVRADMVWRPLGPVVGLVLALAVLVRRRRPLAAVVAGFGCFAGLDLATIVGSAGPFTLYTGGVVLLLVHALFRFGTGHQPAVGAGVAATGWAVATTTAPTGVTDAVGGLVVLALAAALGASLRLRGLVRVQRFEQVRSRERELLARELHDTVAHHVSAVAVQAQAGRVRARADDLAGAAAALELIEAEASRAMAEMRDIVGTLRRADGAERSPTGHDLTGIDALAADDGVGPRVGVDRRGDLADLRPAVASALYRIAQESVTNARRHARGATTIRVRLAGERDAVRLSVGDDGARGTAGPAAPGHGLVGMRERAALLGGTLEAGPRPDGGWSVRACIPRAPGAV